MGHYGSKPIEIQVVLVARQPAPGFKHKKELTVIAHGGETYGDLLERFNTFRAPESQIRQFLDMSGEPISPTATITHTRVYIN